MARIHYNDIYEYEIFNDGYDIYYYGSTISQRAPFDKPYIPEGTYEENCLMQLESLTASSEEDDQIEILRGDVDFFAIMQDVTLPSYEIQEEQEDE